MGFVILIGRGIAYCIAQTEMKPTPYNWEKKRTQSDFRRFESSLNHNKFIAKPQFRCNLITGLFIIHFLNLHFPISTRLYNIKTAKLVTKSYKEINSCGTCLAIISISFSLTPFCFSISINIRIPSSG